MDLFDLSYSMIQKFKGEDEKTSSYRKKAWWVFLRGVFEAILYLSVPSRFG